MAKTKVSSLITYTGNYTSLTFSRFIGELPLIFMAGSVTILSIYFFLSQADRIRILFDRYFYFHQDNGDKFIEMFKVRRRWP